MSKLMVLLPIPADTRAGRRGNAERSRNDLKPSDYYVGSQGEFRWTSNDRCVPSSFFADNFIEIPAKQREVEQAETQAFLADYRREMANHVPSGEELFEMRAAFGTGRTVVNVITGRRTHL